MQNHLKNQTSPYLLQHADNPVDWYPWGEEAFQRAKQEDKPVFLSIGYSTCHWCHVMAHESFENKEIAEILNSHFISVKVDKEERPDIDSIYMSVCQALTGSGGWPTTIFLTPEQKPFFAGTYFPKEDRYGLIGLERLLPAIGEKWKNSRQELLQAAEEIVAFLDRRDEERMGKVPAIMERKVSEKGMPVTADATASFLTSAFRFYQRIFDSQYGGFGDAPKFPTPHNLLFLMQYYEKNREKVAMQMVKKTLLQMYRGGIFDHIGGGFSRYSTDRYFLVPHFEKMLYDNALLILAYSKAYQITGNVVFRDVAEKTATYIFREMTSPEGGFYSAQDADSEGVEGKYYLFEPGEIVAILDTEAGEKFNTWFDITTEGNFEGKNIPNLLENPVVEEKLSLLYKKSQNGILSADILEDNGTDTLADINTCMKSVYEYRRNRYALHLDDKILTSWNSLMIAAMCHLYRITQNKTYLEGAVKAQAFIKEKLCGDTLYVSFRNGKQGGKGFLDDYAYQIFALLALYEAALDNVYLEQALEFCEKAISDFYDEKQGGFYLYGKENEQLILRPKETYDGAMPSGNSMMTYNLVRLYLITGKKKYEEAAIQQLHFMSGEIGGYPPGYAMFLLALSDYTDTPDKITIVLKDRQDLSELSCRIPLSTVLSVLDGPTGEYPLKNDRTTFYVCKGRSCQPPVNELSGTIEESGQSIKAEIRK